MDLPGFTSFEFNSNGKGYRVYARGSGPGVLVMHEVPGITPEMLAFATRVADAGFTVWMPHLFGEPGRKFSEIYAAEEIAKACLSREFAVFASHEASPLANVMRDIGRELNTRVGGRGIGAIGMCITGNFALAMMADEHLLAPVLAQPALPFGWTSGQKQALHISDEQLSLVRARAASGTKFLGMRFTQDNKCPKQRFDRLQAEIGDAFERIEIDSSPGNPFHIHEDAHSVLVHEFVDVDGHPTKQALLRLLAFWHEALK